MPSIGVGSSFMMTMRAPAPLASRHDARDRVDLQRGADREQQVGLAGHGHRARDDLGHQRLAERDRVALQDAAAGPARRIVLAGAHALEHLCIGARWPQPQHMTRRIVPWTSMIRSGALPAT